MKQVVVFTLALGIVLASIPRDVAATPTSTIYSFGTVSHDGKDPKGSLTYVNSSGLDLLFGGTTETVGGTSPVGGASSGVIFQLDRKNPGSTYQIDHWFTGSTDPANPDGADPRHDAMTLLNGQLYGTTLEGGTNNVGTIFSIGQDGTGYKLLANLETSAGAESHSCFVIIDDILYGMTASGGEDDEGVIFSFDPTAPTPTPTATPTPPPNFDTLYSFMCKSAGKEPHGRLTLDPNGTTFYGMTRKGGARGFGVVFSIDTSGNHYTVLHDFNGGADDGATSDHGYVVQSGDHLYGMTTNGGHHNDGVIFKLKIDDGTFQLLHKFGETHHDGKNPYGSLLLDGDKLYGTTANGGDNDTGTVFVINTDGSRYHRLYSFGANSDDGSNPIDNVILVCGALYGMTTGGGANGHGAIFKVSPSPGRKPSPAPRPTPRG
jgi:uncharacterized repeat protein (TIGR03803 family)